MCDDERRLDYVLLGLRDEIAELEAAFGVWLETPLGRFAVWLVERDRS